MESPGPLCLIVQICLESAPEFSFIPFKPTAVPDPIAVPAPTAAPVPTAVPIPHTVLHESFFLLQHP